MPVVLAGLVATLAVYGGIVLLGLRKLKEMDETYARLEKQRRDLANLD